MDVASSDSDDRFLMYILCKNYKGINGDTKTFVKPCNIYINYPVKAFA